MASRLILQQKLETILGSRNVYFQPPETLRLSYPCFIYSLSGIPTKDADNLNYILEHEYKVTLIDKDPDTEIRDKLMSEMVKCRFNAFYMSDNLNHYVFTIRH